MPSGKTHGKMDGRTSRSSQHCGLPGLDGLDDTGIEYLVLFLGKYMRLCGEKGTLVHLIRDKKIFVVVAALSSSKHSTPFSP